MKKFISYLIIILLVIGGIGYFLPTEFRVHKSVVIASTPAKIHEYVGDLQKWAEWTPWKRKDPEIEITLGETTTGIGASQRWNDKHGGGSLRFTSWSPDNGVEYDLSFQSGKYTSSAAIQYNASSSSRTKVDWTLDGDMKMPVVGGYLALFMNYSIGNMFEQGLTQLKVIVEKNK